MDIQTFLTQFDLLPKEAAVFMALYPLGKQPASVIAKKANMGRTTTYHILLNLKKKKFVGSSKKASMQVFYVLSDDVLEQKLAQKREALTRIEHDYPMIATHLRRFRDQAHVVPSIHVYDGIDQVPAFYDDMFGRMMKEGIIEIRLLGSHTFNEELGNLTLKEVATDFFRRMEQHRVQVRALIAEGSIIRERLSLMTERSGLEALPAAQGASNIYLVGKNVFIMSFRDVPVGVHIGHADIAQTMHFVFDMLEGVVG